MAVITSGTADAVERLRAAFDPEEIILFGSRAYGTPRPDSDVDLLLVLRPTDESLDARLRRAREALQGDGWRLVDGHVWAHTPDELRDELRRGNTAIRDALARGERLFPRGGRSRYAELAEEWSATGAKETLLEKAKDDLDTAELILASAAGRRRQWWTAAFHAQQAAEKALKALIYHLGGEPGRTHDLGELALEASQLDPKRVRPLLLAHQARLAELSRYAVAPRYPEGPAVGEAGAWEAVQTARAVLEGVTSITGS